MSRKCTFTCSGCQKDFRVVGDEELLRKCVQVDPRCPHCEGSLQLGSLNRGYTMTELDANEFWNAIHGFGLPEEIVAGPEAVEALLLAHRATAAEVRRTVTGRVELKSLTLANGVKLHLTASGEGAIVFKSTKIKEESDGSENRGPSEREV